MLFAPPAKSRFTLNQACNSWLGFTYSHPSRFDLGSCTFNARKGILKGSQRTICMFKTEPCVPERFRIVQIFGTNVLETRSRGVMLIRSTMKL